MDNCPVLSIIVPVYNAKKYIDEALKSIEAQNFSEDEIEIICIDDGSQDGSGEYLDMVATTKNNIHVIHKKNGGAASARNEGLKHVKSKYYMFMDADDELIPYCIKELIIGMEQEDADICQFQYTRSHEWHNESVTPISFRQENMTILGFVWYYIFKTSKFIKLRFDEKLECAEDLFYVHQVSIQNPKCIITDRICYYYRETPGSLMSSRTPEKMAGVMLRLSEDLKELENEQMDQLSKEGLKSTRILCGRTAGYYMAFSLCAGNNEYPFPMLKEKGLWPVVREWVLLKPKKNKSKLLKDYCVFFIQFRPMWWIMQKTRILYRFRHMLFH